LVVVECFANFLCDDVRDAGDSPDVKSVMDHSLTRHFKTLYDYCLAHRSLTVAVGFPLLRLKPSWFETHYTELLTRFEFEFDTTAPANMKLLRKFNEDLLFEDSVHLPNDQGIRYVNHLVEEGWHLFDQPLFNQNQFDKFSAGHSVSSVDIPVQVTSDDLLSKSKMDALMNKKSSASSLTEDHFRVLLDEIKKNNVTDHVLEVESRVEKVEKSLLENVTSSDLAFAKLYEDQDFSKNSSRENRVTLGSLYLTDPLPSDHPGQLNILKQRVNCLVADLFKQESSRPEVLGVSLKSPGLTP